MATPPRKTNNYAARVDPKLKDHSNDPFVKEKTKRAKALIKKIGVPKELAK